MENIENKPKLIYQKNADKIKNMIIIPKAFIEEHGRQFYMYIYDDCIKLVPVEKGE